MRILILMSFLHLTCLTVCFGQRQQSKVTVCSDKTMHTELVMLNKSFEQSGFTLVQFNTMNMPSGAYLPVNVNMEQGKMYQVNFVASKDFNQYQVTLIDKNRQELMSKKVKQKKGGANKTSESFVAPYTGSFTIILSQKVKGRDEACGGISILKATK